GPGTYRLAPGNSSAWSPVARVSECEMSARSMNGPDSLRIATGHREVRLQASQLEQPGNPPLFRSAKRTPLFDCACGLVRLALGCADMRSALHSTSVTSLLAGTMVLSALTIGHTQGAPSSQAGPGSRGAESGRGARVGGL